MWPVNTVVHPMVLLRYSSGELTYTETLAKKCKYRKNKHYCRKAVKIVYKILLEQCSAKMAL